jgi:hypothetical protein
VLFYFHVSTNPKKEKKKTSTSILEAQISQGLKKLALQAKEQNSQDEPWKK